MALRKIVIIGDEILRKKSKIVTEFDEKLGVLLDDMSETMRKANGAGLSAVQVGVLKRAFIVGTSEGDIEFINPKILKASGKNKILEEGCLSVPKQYSTCVIRPNKVMIEAQDRNGKVFTKEFTGFEAKAISHEYDHLDGILFIDRCSPDELKNI